jgi:hypothetical protein
LWKFNVLVKIKKFGWPVLHGLLPCRGVLVNRHIENSGTCPVMMLVRISSTFFLCVSTQRRFVRHMSVWQEIEREVAGDRSGSVVVAELINRSRPLAFLNHLGLAELILTVAGSYGGREGS